MCNRRAQPPRAAAAPDVLLARWSALTLSVLSMHSRVSALTLSVVSMHSQVRDVLLALWSALTLSALSASSAAARSVGLGMSIGEALGSLCARAASLLEVAARAALSALPPEAVALTYLGPSAALSAAFGVGARALCCAVAYRLQHLAVIFSSCAISAEATIDGRVARPLQPAPPLASPPASRPPRRVVAAAS